MILLRVRLKPVYRGLHIKGCTATRAVTRIAATKRESFARERFEGLSRSTHPPHLQWSRSRCAEYTSALYVSTNLRHKGEHYDTTTELRQTRAEQQSQVNTEQVRLVPILIYGKEITVILN